MKIVEGFPLTPGTVIRVAGPDSLRFLNGQLTQKVELATTDDAVFSAVLNAKGGLDAVCFVRRLSEDEFLLDAPLLLRETLLERLDRYLIADDVELHDESDHWHAWHVLSPERPMSEEAWTCTRLNQAGYDIFSKSPRDPSDILELGEQEVAARRIEAGIPAWDQELTPGLLPPEAKLEDRAVSYDKGCYMGQEIISRMKRAGKTNRLLVQLSIPSGQELALPLTVLDPESGKEAGTLTSISPIPNPDEPEQRLALGFCRSKFLDVPVFDLRAESGTLTPQGARLRS